MGLVVVVIGSKFLVKIWFWLGLGFGGGFYGKGVGEVLGIVGKVFYIRRGGIKIGVGIYFYLVGYIC